jgi:xanthine dehydrogenase molybdenum-binding subunit
MNDSLLEFSYIGQRIEKKDAREKITGVARYGHDMYLPGMLYGGILRSGIAHGSILHIDTSRAKKVTGVRAVITAGDFSCGGMGIIKDNPVLKKDRVRSVKDEIAAVAAVSEDALQEALETIRVDYDELPAVFCPEEAMKPDAPLLHENAKGNVVPFIPYHFIHGDPEKAIENCAFIHEDVYETQPVAHCCMEPCFCLASFGPDGRLTIWSSTQIPNLMQSDVSKVLGIPGNRVRVIQTVTGGAFGSKLDTFPYEMITILLARTTAKPVRITYNRWEEFVSCPTRQPMKIRCLQGCDRKGKLLVRKVDALLDNGAYTSWGVTTPSVMLMGISSLYRVENIEFTAKSIYTNNLFATAMRGYGNPQGTFAIESNLDTLADTAGIDPVDMRVINANEPGEITPQGLHITSFALKECLEKAAGEIGWKGAHRQDENEGIGFAALFHVGGGGRIYRSDGCGCVVKMDDFGKVTVLTGASEIGQGSETALSLIVSEVLGVPPDDVSVVNNDTDICPWDVGVHASRTTFIAGNAARLAALKIRAQLVNEASRTMGIPEAELSLREGFVQRVDDPENRMPISKLVRKLHFKSGGQHLVGDCFYDPPTEMQDRDFRGNFSAAYVTGVQATRVKVDPQTGKVRVLEVVAVHDVGRIINPAGLEGQVEGGIQMGLGFALMEELKTVRGEVLNPTFLDYKMPTAADMPRIRMYFVETNDPEGPFGAKGIGEAGAIACPPAIVNAIHDATGIRFTRLPVTMERVYRALQNDEAAL